MSAHKKSVLHWLKSDALVDRQKLFQDSAVSLYEIPPKPPTAPKLPHFSRVTRKKNLHSSLKLKTTDYLIPDWDGQGLNSKEFYQVLKHLKNLQTTLLADLRKQEFPPRLTHQLHLEYISFARNKKWTIDENEKVQHFIDRLKTEVLHSEQQSYIFALHYSAKALLLFFLQLRLLRLIEQSEGKSWSEKELLSPPLIFAKLFPKGSQRELNMMALSANQYSWYRPCEKEQDIIASLYQLSSKLTMAETIKLFYQLEQHPEILQTTSASKYSHALSHVATGLFLNTLNVNFPNWSQSIQHFSPPSEKRLNVPLSTLFVGDHIEELSLSHWLAQENNLYFSWEQLICPHFGPHFDNRADSRNFFSFLCNEFHFLCLLTKVQRHKSESLLDFLPRFNQEFKKNLYHHPEIQNSLFKQADIMDNPKYDRIFLSLIETPKTNGHSFLVNQITSQMEHLKSDGYLYVLSHQNLFLPSLREKVELFLKKAQIESLFLFDELSSKGEMPAFVYIFKKNNFLREHSKESGKDLEYRKNLMTCSTFRFSGELPSFQNFTTIPDELNIFFNKYLSTIPSLYQNNNKEIQFEFYTDAIINGSLIHSNDSSGTQITHPAFFRKMMKNCFPLDYFFDIQYQDPKSLTSEVEIVLREKQTSFLQIEDFNESSQSKIVLLLNLQHKEAPIIELFESSLLKAKVYEFGVAECFYFILRPKHSDLNYNVLKSYFESELGKQIMALSLKGNYQQLKSRLFTLLVPSCIKQTSPLPPEWSSKYQFFLVNEEQLMNTDPAIIQTVMAQMPELIKNLQPMQYSAVLAQLCQFRSTVKNLVTRSHWEKKHLKEFNFNSIDVRKLLTPDKMFPLFPNHPELKIEFFAQDISLLAKEFNNHRCSLELFHGEIELFHDQTKLLVFRGSNYLMVFLNYLLKQLPAMPVQEMLNRVCLPLSRSISDIIDLKSHQLELWQEWIKQAENNIQVIISQSITS